MEDVIVKETAKVLVPNSEHQNFTETKDTIPEGTTLSGSFKSIQGLRRGKPFSYRVFIDKNGQIIYSNKIKTMKATDVYLGADSSATPTMIDMVPAETFKTSRLVGALAGGVGAFMYSKKKGYDKKKTMKYAVVGGLLGYTAMYIFDKTRSVTIATSK
jgi:hypothetical protein